MADGSGRDGRTDTRRMKAVLCLVAALGFAAAPWFSAGFGGFDPADFPIPQEDPPAQPLGYAFAIWGVIYVWLVAGAGFGLLARADDPDWDRMRWPLIFSLALGIPWISVAVLSPVWATVLIWAMLAGAVVALLFAPAADPWLSRGPVALYAGWLTAAALVALALLGAGWGVGPGETGWAWIALLGALTVGTAVAQARGDAPFYPLGIAWALVAVAGRNWGADWSLAGLATVGAAYFLVLAAASFRRG